MLKMVSEVSLMVALIARCSVVVSLGKKGSVSMGGEMDRVMDEDDETTPARGARVVTTDGDEVVKWYESGSRS